MKFSGINASNMKFWLKDILGCENFVWNIKELIIFPKMEMETGYKLGYPDNF